jgi:hypothetical protein
MESENVVGMKVLGMLVQRLTVLENGRFFSIHLTLRLGVMGYLTVVSNRIVMKFLSSYYFVSRIVS